MRAFFALQPSSSECLAIEHWRNQMLPPLDRPVPAANFHITLAFLGNLTNSQFEGLLNAVNQAPTMPVISVYFDELGYWPKPGILWIGTSDLSNNIHSLASNLKTTSRRAGLQLENRAYQPHLTLARRCHIPPPASAAPPDLTFDFQTFCLFESVKRRSGIHYETIAEWSLAETG